MSFNLILRKASLEPYENFFNSLSPTPFTHLPQSMKLISTA